MEISMNMKWKAILLRAEAEASSGTFVGGEAKAGWGVPAEDCGCEYETGLPTNRDYFGELWNLLVFEVRAGKYLD